MYNLKPKLLNSKSPSISPASMEFSLDLNLVSFQLQSSSPPRYKNEPHYRTFDFYSISHLLGGQGVFWYKGKMTIVYPGQAIIVCPGEMNDYFGLNDFYIEDGIDFAGPVADYLHENRLLITGVVELGEKRCLDSIINDSISLGLKERVRAKTKLIDLLLSLPARINVNGHKMLTFQAFEV